MFSNGEQGGWIAVVAPKLMIYCGTFMFLLGLVGNILNVLVFSVWSDFQGKLSKFSRQHRSSQCPLYLFVASLNNLIVVVYSLLTRIMFDGYAFSISQRESLFFCKLRYFVLHTCDLISLSCICLATLDRFLITSRNARLRKLTKTRSQSVSLISAVVFVHLLHGVPLIIYFDASDEQRCSISSQFYSFYYFYVFQILLHSLIPVLFLSIFNFLTLQQIQLIGQINRISSRQRDKQLSRMLVLISSAIIVSSIPYCIEQFYSIISNDSSNNSSSFVFLYHVVSSLLFYVNPVTSFYIFFISSPNFRLQIRKIFRCKRRKPTVRISSKQKEQQ